KIEVVLTPEQSTLELPAVAEVLPDTAPALPSPAAMPARPAPANRWAAPIMVGLASLGGIAFVLLMTVMAVVMSRGAPTHAGVLDADPVKVKDADEPGWKRTLRKAVDNHATWDEARLDMLRARVTSSSAAQVKQIDDALLKMPTPLDFLKRDKFEAV